MATIKPSSLEKYHEASKNPEAAPKEADDPAATNYNPRSINFWLVMLSNFVAVFLVALDRTILATAIPRITDNFKSLGDIGWYGSAYMLTTAASQLLFGRIYKFYNLKIIYFGSIVVFEIGSLICGAAANSSTFIVGRAIAGFGSAGIFTGAMMVMVSMVPVYKRPMFQGVFGMVFGVASVVGPLLGGVLAGKATWRWCFYMNLPIGGVALALLFFLLNLPEKSSSPAPWVEHITRLDPLGTFFFVPSVVSLLLALQWGGSKFPWSDGRIIALFVVFAVAFAAFASVQVLMPKTAQVPMRIISQRSMLAGCFFNFFLAASMMLALFYVPLWFQTVKNFDPVQSGIYTLPLVLSIVASSIISGVATQNIGYYVPSMILCPSLMAIGQGLMSTFAPNSGTGEWVGFQFITGFGLGFGMQTVNLAVQTVLPREDVSTGMAISFFGQQLGGAIFLCVGQALFNNIMGSRLAGIPGIDAATIVDNGATDLRGLVPEDAVDAVVSAYNAACTKIFMTAMALALATLLSALCMQWRNIKQGKRSPPPGVSSTAVGGDKSPA
ncbi:azole resistance protein [Plectosphaerella plurivora]|uniref:Azole resistance protein n=1 Tax=Plectosphaerella plurivora TaxID=936078 RepID=A0A9P8VFQ8_9PEZI|nr:azole resistance protein [Plectosphaerella plurivora]